MFLMSKKATVEGILFRSACTLSFNKPEKVLPTKLKQHLDRANLAKYKLLFQLMISHGLTQSTLSLICIIFFRGLSSSCMYQTAIRPNLRPIITVNHSV